MWARVPCRVSRGTRQVAGLTALNRRELGGEGRCDAGVPQLHNGRALVLQVPQHLAQTVLWGGWQQVRPGHKGEPATPPETHPLRGGLLLWGWEPQPLLGCPGGGPDAAVAQDRAVAGPPPPLNNPLWGVGQECHT